MQVKITNYGKSGGYMSPKQIGLTSHMFHVPSIYTVSDKKLFFMSVIKYGITFRSVIVTPLDI